jgi:hypothetical protein
LVALDMVVGVGKQGIGSVTHEGTGCWLCCFRCVT